MIPALEGSNGSCTQKVTQVLEATHKPKVASLNSDAVLRRPMSVYELIFLRFRSSRLPQKNFEWEELRRSYWHDEDFWSLVAHRRHGTQSSTFEMSTGLSILCSILCCLRRSTG